MARGQRLKAIWTSPRLAASAVLTAGGIAVYGISYPGSMEDDSFVQLVEGRTGSYSNWHPPVMSWLLGVSDALPGPPAAWFIAFTMLLFFAALAGVIWLPRRVGWTAVIAAAALFLLPQVLLLQAVVWKDSLFANAVLAGFVCLGLAAKWWRLPRLRFGLIVAAAALFALAILTRQNGAVVLPCALGALFAVALRRGRRSAWVTSGVFLLLTATMTLSWNALLQLRADGYQAKEAQFKILELYDITGMVNRDLDLPLTVFDREAPKLAKIIRGEGLARWSPQMNDTLEVSPRIVEALEGTPASIMARQWRTLIWHYPLRYLSVRALLFRWVLQPPDVALCHPFHVGDEGDAGDLKALGIAPRLDKRDLALWRLGDIYLKTPLFSHGLFSLVLLAALLPLARRRRDTDLIMIGLIAATAIFTATFFVLSIACDYRYLYLIDVTALACLLYVAADWRGLLRQQKGGRQAPSARDKHALF